MADRSEYTKALKMGQRAARSAQLKGEYPYLPALDEFLPSADIQTEMPLGLMDIPLDQIVGTKTTGRQNAFASNFMPLISENSEFAAKWTNLYNYQLDEGVKDPIICYEYMNKYYVLEGNKRVSVFKYLNAYSIEGNVTRIIPRMSSDPQVKIFYEYMEFFSKTGINYIWFSKEGCFALLVHLCGMAKDEIWNDDQRADFSSNFGRFRKLFEEKGGRNLQVTAGDAFLFYIGIYPYSEIDNKSEGELRKELDKLWKEFDVIKESPADTLVMSPEETAEAGMFTRFFLGTGSKYLKIAFIHDKPVEDSGWVYSHDLGRSSLENVFADRIETHSYFADETEESKTKAIETAISDGNHILFTTSQSFLDASLKCALEHPEVKILNCSVNRPHQALRTYYGRMYEAKFLEGIIAGVMADNNKIAFRADYPIYGTTANINAFALGVKMTNPRAKVYVNWACVKDGEDLDAFVEREGIQVIADRDFIRPGSEARLYGLYKRTNHGVINLAAPIWNWGKFYERIIRDILSGSWNSAAKTKKALNYWWGISGDIIDLVTSKNLPSGVNDLVRILRDQIHEGSLRPFQATLRRQDGSLVASERAGLSAEEIITMDYLADNVIGSIPGMEELTDEGKRLVFLQGVTAGAEEL